MRIAAPLLVAMIGGCGPAPEPKKPIPDTGTPVDPWVCEANRPSWTVGLVYCTPEATPGYTLFAPLTFSTTYLIDLHGQLVHSWESDFLPGEAVYLEPNGHLLRAAEDNRDVPFRAGGAGGRLQEFDWDGNLVWEFVYKGEDHCLHHDMKRLPNGNVLAIAWESITAEEAVALGRDPELVGPEGLWADHLIEVNPATNAIVWEWHVLDHVIQDRDPTAANYGVLAEHPGRIDFDVTWANFGGGDADWNHSNGLDYNAELDQIVLSAHNQDEIWVLDHGTTTEEAAGATGGRYGRGGELLYRWGSPANHGAPGAAQLSGQHDPEWIDAGSPGAGNLLLMNNGNAFGFSAVFELATPVQADGSYPLVAGAAFAPEAPVWSYSDPGVFYSSYISGSQRLPSGNTLICEGDAGRFFEVTPDARIVWEYRNPVGPIGPVDQGSVFGGGGLLNASFRADRYPVDYAAFEGRDLTPQGTIER